MEAIEKKRGKEKKKKKRSLRQPVQGVLCCVSVGTTWAEGCPDSQREEAKQLFVVFHFKAKELFVTKIIRSLT